MSGAGAGGLRRGFGRGPGGAVEHRLELGLADAGLGRLLEHGAAQRLGGLERAEAREAAGCPLPRWFPTLFAALDHLESGSVEVRLPDGRRFTARGTRPGPAGRIDVRDVEPFPRLVRQSDMAFPEAYMEGWWSTPDLQSLVDVLVENNDAVCYSFPGSGLVRALERLRHALRANTRAAPGATSPGTTTSATTSTGSGWTRR